MTLSLSLCSPFVHHSRFYSLPGKRPVQFAIMDYVRQIFCTNISSIRGCWAEKLVALGKKKFQAVKSCPHPFAFQLVGWIAITLLAIPYKIPSRSGLTRGVAWRSPTACAAMPHCGQCLWFQCNKPNLACASPLSAGTWYPQHI